MEKRVIGLTGGIASGKSTVTAYLRKLGYKVIDADELVHDLQEPNRPLYKAILKNFGSTFFQTNGQMNRKKLAAFVFSEPSARQKLSQIQDQMIRKAIERALNEALSKEELPIFLDIPLLFEEKYDPLCDEVWLVYLPEAIQLERLMKRSSLTKEEAQLRISAQMPLEEKVKFSDVLLDNSKTIEDLQRQIDRALTD